MHSNLQSLQRSDSTSGHRAPPPAYGICGHRGPLDLHHIASRAVAPDAVIALCRECHEELHARHARLWRAPKQDPGAAELARLGLCRLTESVEFLGEQRPSLYIDGSLLVGAVAAYCAVSAVVNGSVVALDAIAELLLRHEETPS